MAAARPIATNKPKARNLENYNIMLHSSYHITNSYIYNRMHISKEWSNVIENPTFNLFIWLTIFPNLLTMMVCVFFTLRWSRTIEERSSGKWRGSSRFRQSEPTSWHLKTEERTDCSLRGLGRTYVEKTEHCADEVECLASSLDSRQCCFYNSRCHCQNCDQNIF